MAEKTRIPPHIHMAKGYTCPKCASNQIVGEEVDIEGNEAKQACHCLDCGADWVDTYTLSSCVITGKNGG